MKLLGQEVSTTSSQEVEKEEESSQAPTSDKERPLQVPTETDRLTAPKPQPVLSQPSTAGTTPTSVEDMPISSETTCSSFSATFTPPISIPVCEGMVLGSDNLSAAASVGDHIQEQNDDNKANEMNGEFKSVTTVVESQGIKNTFYETIC